MTSDFIAYSMEYYNSRFQAGEISFHTWNNSLSQIRSFSQFLREKPEWKDLQFETFTDDLLMEYRSYLLEKGNQAATVNRKLVPLVLTLRQAGKEGILSPQLVGKLSNPYLSPSKARYFSFEEAAAVRFLTQEQLSRLVARYERLAPGRERDVLEIFLFSFHACGLRVSDIVTLEWKHIDWRQATLTKTLIKTHARLIIPLSASAMDILQTWRSRKRNSRFVFDLLPEEFDFSDDGALERAIDNRNRTMRTILNRIGKELGFSNPLGMHVARHTFAVMALNNGGVDVHLISRLLGHSSVTITEKAYATLLLPTLSSALRNHLSFPEFGVKKREIV